MVPSLGMGKGGFIGRQPLEIGVYPRGRDAEIKAGFFEGDGVILGYELYFDNRLRFRRAELSSYLVEFTKDVVWCGVLWCVVWCCFELCCVVLCCGVVWCVVA